MKRETDTDIATRPSSRLTKLTFSSRSYFQFLLDLITNDWLDESFGFRARSNQDAWMDELLAGYVTSADTGNEELVIASRAALAGYCDARQENLEHVCASLLRNLQAHQGQDRIVVPTLEIIAFLFSVGFYQQAKTVDLKSLCLQTQKAGYKSGNVRKLEACVKLYRGVAAMEGDHANGLAPPTMASKALTHKRIEAVAEARKRLGALMIHPWPRIRHSVIDELWGLMSSTAGANRDRAERLKGVDWGVAEKGVVNTLVTDLDLP